MRQHARMQYTAKVQICAKMHITETDLHLTYSKNGVNGVGIKMIKSGNFQYFSIKFVCRGCVLELPRRGDSNTHPQHMILWRTYDN